MCLEVLSYTGSVTCSFMQAFDLRPVFSGPSVLCVYAVITSCPVHDPELPTHCFCLLSKQVS